MDSTWKSGLDHENGQLKKGSSYETMEVNVLKANLLNSHRPSSFPKAMDGVTSAHCNKRSWLLYS